MFRMRVVVCARLLFFFEESWNMLYSYRSLKVRIWEMLRNPLRNDSSETTVLFWGRWALLLAKLHEKKRGLGVRG